jgi:hypothetical protein
VRHPTAGFDEAEASDSGATTFLNNRSFDANHRDGLTANERAPATRAHSLLHVNRLKPQKLLRSQIHRVAVRVISGRARYFGGQSRVLSQLSLLLGVASLVLVGGRDSSAAVRRRKTPLGFGWGPPGRPRIEHFVCGK